MKFKLPPYCASLSHGGVTYAAGEDGTIDVPEADATLLASHGILPWEEDTLGLRPSVPHDEDIKTMTRSGLVAAYRALGVDGPVPRSNEKLRAALRDLTFNPAASVVHTSTRMG